MLSSECSCLQSLLVTCFDTPFWSISQSILNWYMVDTGEIDGYKTCQSSIIMFTLRPIRTGLCEVKAESSWELINYVTKYRDWKLWITSSVSSHIFDDHTACTIVWGKTSQSLKCLLLQQPLCSTLLLQSIITVVTVMLLYLYLCGRCHRSLKSVCWWIFETGTLEK